MRRLLRFLALVLLLAAVVPAAAEDTGTYRLLDYRVLLTPHSDGVVAIDYYQQWKVTGGHIPWITIGLPGDDYDITKSGGAVKKIAPANQGDWSGVRIDLDRDYRPGQSFEVSFSVNQRKLFYADDENYKLDFTPGWYDNAGIDSLTIRLKSFADLDRVRALPKPVSMADDVLTWSADYLAEGARYSISISFPKRFSPHPLPGASLNRVEREPEGGSGIAPGPFWETPLWPAFLVGAGVLLLVALLAWLGAVFGWNTYTGGGIFYGGGSGDGGGGLGGGDGGAFTGGGGGFGGGGFSCACACVSCACACACAGGGGAGCTRKRTTHVCPVCRPITAPPLAEMT